MLPFTQTTLAVLGSVAVWVTGSLSLLGLLISKEQKVSELRQEWIDELRLDLAALVAHSHQIHSYMVFAIKTGKTDLLDLWKATREDYLELNGASTRIKLRLNRSECDCRLILNSMIEMEALFERLNKLFPHGDDSHTIDEIKRISDAIERDAPPLLKKEWERVKMGEPFFRRLRWTALILSSSLLVFFIIPYAAYLIRTFCRL